MTEEEIRWILNNNGITDSIISYASKMDISLVSLVYEKLTSNDKALEDSLLSTLIGIYGNYYANLYIKRLGYRVFDEAEVYNNGEEVTKADISFLDKDSNINRCEVKTAFQILSNTKNYDSRYDHIKDGVDVNLEKIKYKNMGDKLLKQVSKLNKEGMKVNVILYDGCILDDGIRDKLSKDGINVVYLDTNIAELYVYIKEMLEGIKKDIQMLSRLKAK